MPTSTLLNQIVAIEKGQKTRSNEAITKAYQLLSSSPELLVGLTRIYTPLTDGPEHQLPAESKKVQVRADEVLEAIADEFARLINITATKDWANTAAVADIVVDDSVILHDVPVTHLLFLEKQLVDLHTVISKLPRLAITEDWSYDTNRGVYITEPVDTVRNVKIQEPLTLAQATDKHPAQVQLITKDVPAGTWSTVKLSGAMPADTITVLLERVEALQKAIKFAREQANMLEVTNITDGDVLLNYVMDGTIPQY